MRSDVDFVGGVPDDREGHYFFTTVIVICDGYRLEWCTTLCATTPRVSSSPRRAAWRALPHGSSSPYPTRPIGNRRTRVPVAAKRALHTAGAIGGSPASPTPPGGASLRTSWTSICGVSASESMR